MSETREGSCFCGAVQIAVGGAPLAEGFCHCASCRSWSAAPVNAFTLWKPDAVRVVRGNEHVREFAKTPRSVRKFCGICGGHLLTEHPTLGVVDVYAATIPAHRHAPTLHVNYGESVLAIADGLPKFADMPAELGGTGVRCPE